MQEPADILEENERLRIRVQQLEDVVRAFPGGDVDALVDERAAVEANRLCNEILAQVADAIIAVDKSDRIIYLNAAAERLYRIAASEALGRSQADVFTRSWVKSDDEAAAATALRENGEWCGENVHVGHDGRELSVQCRITALKDNKGLPNGRVAVIHDVSKCKQHDKRVLVSEIRYRRLFEAAHDGVLIVDPETRKIVDANPFMIQLLGYPLADLVDMEIFELGFLGDAQAAKDMFQTLKASGQVRYENLPLQTEDGASRSVEVVANLYDEDGHSVIQFNVRDITERRRAETELRERQTFLNRIFEVLPGVLYIFDLDESRVVFVNKTAALTFSTEEIVGMGADVMPNLMHPDDQKGFEEHTARIRSLSSGATATFEYRMRDKANEWRWYLSTDTVILRDESGVARQFIGVALEITDRKRVEFALQESEAKYRTLFEIMQEGFSVLERVDGNPLDYRFLAANPAYERHTGLSNPVGKTMREIVPSVEESTLESYRSVEETGLSQIVVTHVPDIDLWFEVEASSAKQPGQIAVLFRNITERKRAEAALRERQERQAFVLKLSDALRAESSAEAMTDRALRMLFDEMRLDRCYVGIYGLAEDTAEFPHQVHDDRLPPLPARVRLSDFPDALQIASDRTLVIDDIMKMDGLSDAERASFAGLGIGALIVATLRKGENAPLWAIIAVSSSPRVWTSGEISLVEDVAERTWAAVKRARAKDRLQIANDTFRNLVDRSPFGTYIIDADFRLIQISDGGQKAFANVRPLIGRDFTEVVHAVWPEPFASEVIAHFRHTLATGEPFKALTNERRADIEATEAYDWKIERMVLPDGRPGVVCHFYDFSEKQQQEDRIKLLMGEVNHRSKNMLGLIEAIARQTVKTQPEDFLEVFGQRVRALSASQDLLVKGEWKAVQLGELIRSQLAHFGDELDGRITIDGPLVQITASASQSLGMAVHELATNAAKFGALSNEAGRVMINWSLQSDVTGQELFAMSWIESGGPPVAEPTRRGFGSTVIDGMLRMSLGCDAEVDFAPTGLVWRIGCTAAGLIESEVGPLSRPNGTAAGQEHAPVTGRRILVVEDESLIAMDFSQTLSEAGYVVIGPANSVARALALLAQFGCDAAVLDVNLAKETSEPVARELIKLGTPFVATSGYSREQLPEIMQTAPLLSKPVSSAMLIAEVDRFLIRE